MDVFEGQDERDRMNLVGEMRVLRVAMMVSSGVLRWWPSYVVSRLVQKK